MDKREDWGTSDAGFHQESSSHGDNNGDAGSYDNGNSYSSSYGNGNSYGSNSSSYGWAKEMQTGEDQKKDDMKEPKKFDEGEWRRKGCKDMEEPDKRSRKKGSTGKGILIGVLIVLIPLLAVIGGGAYFLKSTGSRISIISGSGLNLEAIENKLSVIQNIIDSSFLFDYDEEELTEKIYAGYLSGLGDPYSCYYTAEEYHNITESNEGTYYGIGVMIAQEVDTGRVYIIRVFSGSPSEEAGMKAGDIIQTVAGEEVTGMDLSEVVALIKGTEGTTIQVSVYRETEKKELTMDMERRQVDVDTVYYKMLDNKIGYLELTEFDTVSTKQFKSALEDLKSQGMKSLILDLRNNPGGILDVAVDIADELIDTGVVVSIMDKNGNSNSYEAETEGALGMPLAVLVNGDSASASEVLSGCIRDYGAGTLVGTQTFGKGIVQKIIPLTDGTAIKITMAHYYTPNGTDIHGEGIAPDVVVEDDKETKDVDEQLEAAIEILTKKEAQ